MAGWGDGAWGGTHWGGDRVGATYIDTNTTLAAGTTTWTVETVVSSGVKLTFPPASTATLIMDNKNLIIYGELEMHPTNASIIHAVQFSNVNEQAFVGAPPPKSAQFVGDTSWNKPGVNMGSMIPSTTDIGLWCMEKGILDLVGTPKVAWNRTGTDPTWSSTDAVLSVPFRSGNYLTFNDHYRNGVLGFYNKFDPVTDQLQSVVGSDGVTYVQEAFNLTRNVIIRGTPGHKSHCLIMTPGVTQVLKYVRFEDLGPRKILVNGETDVFRGRWAGVHFHHLMDTVGTLAEGCVVVNGTGHAFVAHDSNDVTFRDCISYHTIDDAYWWDHETVLNGNHIPAQSNADYSIAPDQNSANITYEHCMAAWTYMLPGENQSSLVGFLLQGLSGTAFDCVAVGNAGSSSAAGYTWPESDQGVWDFHDNVSHNNQARGIYIWQNTGSHHQLFDTVLFRNGQGGVTNGAYDNNYHHKRCISFQNAGSGDTSTDFIDAAGPAAFNPPNYRQVLQDCVFGDFGIIHHVVDTPPGGKSVIRNNHLGSFRINEDRGLGSIFKHAEFDFVENDLEEPEDFCNIAHPHAGAHKWIFVCNGLFNCPHDAVPSVLRCQRADGTAFKLQQVANSSTDWNPVTIAAFAFSIPPQSLTSGAVGTAYSQAVVVANPTGGGVAPFTWGLATGSGPLPPGLALSAAGVLNGTPTVAGTYPVTFQATDLSTQDARRTISVTVASGAVLQITTSSLPGGVLGDPYPGATITASGGFPPYSFSIASGSLPPGLTLTAGTGAIAGTPTAAGTYAATFRVTDSLAATAQRALSIAVQDLTPVFENVDLGPSEIGVAYEQSMSATGGVAPYTFAVQIGPLPSGITMSSAGEFSGTPALVGDYPLRLRVTDSQGHGTSKDYILFVYDALSMLPQSLPDGPVGQLYAAGLVATGGAPPLSFTGEGGLPQPIGIPPGLAMDESGVVSGTPTTEDVYVFNVVVTDSVGVTATQPIDMQVTEAAPIVEGTRELQLSFALRRPHGGSRMRDKV